MRWRLRVALARCRYGVGVRLAVLVCMGNRYGEHTPAFAAYRPMGGECFCARVRRRLDFIPF